MVNGTNVRANPVTRLTDALAAQKVLYMQILDLARQQSQLVAAGRNEDLVAVLAARSRLIDQVSPLDRELHPFKGRWQEVLDGLPAAERATVGTLLREVQELLGSILDQDERDKESLVRQKAAVGVQVARTVNGAAANRAYGARPRVGSVIG